MSCRDADVCKKYRANVGNPYPHQSPCTNCQYDMSDYERGFENGYLKFYERINDFLDTHGTNETLIREQLNIILKEVYH